MHNLGTPRGHDLQMIAPRYMSDTRRIVAIERKLGRAIFEEE